MIYCHVKPLPIGDWRILPKRKIHAEKIIVTLDTPNHWMLQGSWGVLLPSPLTRLRLAAGAESSLQPCHRG